MRSFSKVLLAGVSIGSVAAFVLVGWSSRPARSTSRGALDESTVLRLPFTIPCAQQSADAGLVYGALRSRNRPELERLFAGHRLVVMRKGTKIRVTRFGMVGMLSIEPNRASAEVCFVPDELLSLLNRPTEMSSPVQNRP
jgi:hypothetical protein